jgi:hypothetical protein
MTASNYTKTTHMKKIFLLLPLFFVSCLREDMPTPCVEQVRIQWIDEAGCEKKGKIYSLSKDEQEMLQSWIRDFVRTAHVDYVSYAPVLVIRGERFFINILQNSIILNIEKKDGGDWMQISRKRKGNDEEIVDLAKKIIICSAFA